MTLLFYQAGFNLSKNTTTGKLTTQDLLNAFYGVLPDGR